MVAVIELTWSSVAGDAIALDIAKVGTRRAEIAAGDPGVARLDDDAAAAWRNQSAGRPHPGAHAAAEAARCDVAGLPPGARAGLAALAQHLLPERRQSCPGGVADASELGLEVVLRHGDHLVCGSCGQQMSARCRSTRRRAKRH